MFYYNVIKLLGTSFVNYTEVVVVGLQPRVSTRHTFKFSDHRRRRSSLSDNISPQTAADDFPTRNGFYVANTQIIFVYINDIR